jgi:hypothetical protein
MRHGQMGGIVADNHNMNSKRQEYKKEEKKKRSVRHSQIAKGLHSPSHFVPRQLMLMQETARSSLIGRSLAVVVPHLAG